MNDECDTETGQCRCRAGSTGRDCSECTAYRHVFINNVCTCKEILLPLNLFRGFSSSLTDLIIFFFLFVPPFSPACNDNCTGILLDNLAALAQELAEGTVHIADGYVPPPWQELSYIDSNTTEYLEEMNRQNRLKQRMKNIPWNKYRELLKEVEVLFRTVSVIRFCKKILLLLGNIRNIYIYRYFIFQANEQAKRSDILNSKSNDLKNNIFSAKIEMENLKKYIEGDRLGEKKEKKVAFQFYILSVTIIFIVPDTILLLNQYSNENKRIELKKALKTAKMILNGMKEANLTRKRMEVERFLELVEIRINNYLSLFLITIFLYSCGNQQRCPEDHRLVKLVVRCNGTTCDRSRRNGRILDKVE